LLVSCLLYSTFLAILGPFFAVVSKTYYFVLVSLLGACLIKGPFLVAAIYG
jgi:hypothetical protein